MEQRVREVSHELEKIKVKADENGKGLLLKFDIVQKQCETHELQIERLRNNLEDYIKQEEERRKTDWRVEVGEEARIEMTGNSTISALLHLSNKTMVVALHGDDSDMSLEIFDEQDFEKNSTVVTNHSEPITCMAEHRKLLLTGSRDCTICFWDIHNSFTLL